MRNLRTGLFIILVCFWLPAGALAEVTCTADASANKVHMPEVSDPVGYCATFAVRALLHEFRCAEDGKNCELPAMLDLIRDSRKHYDHIESNGPINLLNALEAEGLAVADEKCLSYREFWDSSENPALEKLTFQTGFTDAVFAKVEHRLSLADRCTLKAIGAGLPLTGVNFAGFIERQANALLEEMNAFAEKQKCPRRKIPPFEKWALRYEDDPAPIKMLLKQGHSLMVSLEVPEPDGKRSGPHAVTLTNFREECCAGVCVAKYQVLDSLGHYWAPSAHDGWVSDVDLENRIIAKSAVLFLRKKDETSRFAGYAEKIFPIRPRPPLIPD